MPTELTTKRIEEIAFAVLRAHNDDRLWRALTYDSGPYDVTKATLALQDLASAFFRAGITSAPVPAQQQVPELPSSKLLASIVCSTTKGLDMLDAERIYAVVRREIAELSPPAAPAQAVPLTASQINEATPKYTDLRQKAAFEDGARFAERAHGIKAAP